jgi:hypothetical protein
MIGQATSCERREHNPAVGPYSRFLSGSGGGCVECALVGGLGSSDRWTSASSAWLSMSNSVTSRLPHALHLNVRA